VDEAAKAPDSGAWHLYLIECEDGSYYAGIATDVARRYEEHRTGKGARYTRSHKPLRLLGCRPCGSRSAALKAELALKKLPKAKKLAALLNTPAAD
jgi:putative endonuclease